MLVVLLAVSIFFIVLWKFGFLTKLTASTGSGRFNPSTFNGHGVVIIRSLEVPSLNARFGVLYIVKPYVKVSQSLVPSHYVDVYYVDTYRVLTEKGKRQLIVKAYIDPGGCKVIFYSFYGVFPLPRVNGNITLLLVLNGTYEHVYIYVNGSLVEKRVDSCKKFADIDPTICDLSKPGDVQTLNLSIPEDCPNPIKFRLVIVR